MLLVKCAFFFSSLVIITSSSPGRNQILKGPLPSSGPAISAIFSSKTAELIYAEQMVPTAGDAIFVYHSIFNYDFGVRGAYAGIQHSDGNVVNPEGVPLVYCNIFSVWDVKPDENSTVPADAKLVYGCPGLRTGKFGGEGTGLQTDHPMPWSRDTWYATVHRRWYKPNETVTYLANFMYDYGTQNWTHYATVSVPEADAVFQTEKIGGFLEAYRGEPDGYYSLWRRYHKMHADGVWEKPLYYSASAGGPPKLWNAEVVGKDAIKVIAGGEFPNEQESKNFTLESEDRPKITILRPIVKDLDFEVMKSRELFSINVTWEVDTKAPPQFSFDLKVFDDAHVLVAEKSDTIPHCRDFRFDLPENATVQKGQIELKIVSIFDVVSDVVKTAWNTPRFSSN